MFYEKNSDIDRVPWKIARILLDDFDLSLLTRIPYKKDTNCKIAPFFEQLVHNLFKMINIMNAVFIVKILDTWRKKSNQ